MTRNTAVVESVVPYILSKTQHKFPSIREFALNMLATLILEDYLKLRGSLLIYILASTLDPLREIRELSMELVLKYTLEKNEGFMRNCLLECPFVFNGCPCFGQSSISRSNSENVLRGAGQKASRDQIYRHLIKKIDPVYLYNYFCNVSRLAEHIEKSRTLAKSSDEQAAVVDFLFICTEICIVNARHKRSIDKIIKDTQNGEKTLGDDPDREMADAEAAAVAEAGVGQSSKGSRGRKNQPTMANALLAVERIIPHIVQAVELLRTMNAKVFNPIVDKLCMELCQHFEAMFEYAQPREFWAKYVEMAAKAASSVASTPKRQTMAQSKLTATEKCVANVASALVASMPSSKKRAAAEPNQNDSGQYTMDDPDEAGGSGSRSTKKDTPSERQSMSSRHSVRHTRHEATLQTPPGRSLPVDRFSLLAGSRTPLNDEGDGRRTPSGRHTPLHLREQMKKRLTMPTTKRRLIDDDDSDSDSIRSSTSTSGKSCISYVSNSSPKPSTSKAVQPQFVRKRRNI